MTETTAPKLTDDELRLAYRIATRNRSMDERIVRLISQGVVKFAIYGPGQEAHGTASALAWHKATGGGDHFAFSPHYRSGTTMAMWMELLGREELSRDIIRQQLSKGTDPFGGGRQMVNHIVDLERGILPIQSALGMNLGKGAGYAKAMQLDGIDDGFVVAAIGDGSTAEGDLHDAMNAISTWRLPMCVMITDNSVAISTLPEDGRGIKDFSTYAQAFDLAFFQCDGRDFFAVYETAYAVARYCIENQRGAVWHVTDLPRLNGHSSAGDYRFDLEADDPLLLMGEELVRRGVLESEDIVKRIPGQGADYFAHHDLGRIMGEEDAQMARRFDEVKREPDPEPDSIWTHARPPLPHYPEPAGLADRHTTAVTYAGALRAAHRDLLSERKAAAWGQDIGRLGGVMQATAGLKALFGDRVIDAPLNEPLIVGTAVGAGLYDGFTAVPEIQFGDYSLNAFHWLVYMGNLYWSSKGLAQTSLILRMPVDPFGGGAMYHSMSLDGYFTSIPGLVVVTPSTAYDAYGLFMAAAEYGGPVVFLEPKYCYRRYLGPAFPDEPRPDDKAGIKELKDSVRRGGIPDVGKGVRVPLGKGIVRRSGSDLTVVGWGRGALFAQEAAESMAHEGLSIEVIDLRTLVPLDMDLILQSVRKTGRLVVAADDRTFASFHREVQAAVVEAMPGVPTRAVGMRNVPGIAQNEHLEEYTVLSPQRVADACHQVLRASAAAAHQCGPSAWSWVPPRYYVG